MGNYCPDCKEYGKNRFCSLCGKELITREEECICGRVMNMEFFNFCPSCGRTAYDALRNPPPPLPDKNQS
jgi:NADH pyrophosphatase NudC (nudix superfamily)